MVNQTPPVVTLPPKVPAIGVGVPLPSAPGSVPGFDPVYSTQRTIVRSGYASGVLVVANDNVWREVTVPGSVLVIQQIFSENGAIYGVVGDFYLRFDDNQNEILCAAGTFAIQTGIAAGICNFYTTRHKFRIPFSKFQVRVPTSSGVGRIGWTTFDNADADWSSTH